MVRKVVPVAVEEAARQLATRVLGTVDPLVGVAVESDVVEAQAREVADVLHGLDDAVARDVHGEVDVLADAAARDEWPHFLRNDGLDQTGIGRLQLHRPGDLEAPANFFQPGVDAVEHGRSVATAQDDGIGNARPKMKAAHRQGTVDLQFKPEPVIKDTQEALELILGEGENLIVIIHIYSSLIGNCLSKCVKNISSCFTNSKRCKCSVFRGSGGLRGQIILLAHILLCPGHGDFIVKYALFQSE